RVTVEPTICNCPAEVPVLFVLKVSKVVLSDTLKMVKVFDVPNDIEFMSVNVRLGFILTLTEDDPALGTLELNAGGVVSPLVRATGPNPGSVRFIGFPSASRKSNDGNHALKVLKMVV